MRTSHALLLRLFHDPQYEFGKVSVEYVDRGSPGDRSRVLGDRIIRLEQGFIGDRIGDEDEIHPHASHPAHRLQWRDHVGERH